MTAHHSGGGFSLTLAHQPSDRSSTQTAGRVLQPHIVVEVTGPIVTRRYFAYAYGGAGTNLAGKLSTDEGYDKKTGAGGLVSFEFEDLRITNRGTHTILISVLVQNADGSGYDECGQIETEPIDVS